MEPVKFKISIEGSFSAKVDGRIRNHINNEVLKLVVSQVLDRVQELVYIEISRSTWLGVRRQIFYGAY